MDLNVLAQYIQNRYSNIDFVDLELGGVRWALDSERRINAIMVEEFVYDIYRPDPKAPDFEEEVDCECGAVLPASPTRVQLTGQLVVVSCLPEQSMKGLLSSRDGVVLGFDIAFRNILKSFIKRLNRSIIDELSNSIGNNPLNSPISPLPRTAQLWNFVDAKPDPMGAIDFRSELDRIGVTNYSIVAGGKFDYACTKNEINSYLDFNLPPIDGLVIDNHYVYGFIKPILGLNSFTLRINGASIGAKLTTNQCNDNDVRIILGARYGVSSSKQLLETGIYLYRLL
jgi:hypothetical protein